MIHDNYLINLASPNPVLRTRSVQAFHQELVRAMALGADYLVAHPGSGRGSDRSAAISAIAQGLRQATRGLKLGASGLRICSKTRRGRERRWVRGSRSCKPFSTRARICDSVYASTPPIFSPQDSISGLPEGLEGTLQVIDRTVGLDRMAVVHVNDSKTHLGSRVDRHEHIGKGKIGLEAFRAILNHPLLAGRAFILETPIDKPGDDRRNVAALWKLVGREVTGGQARGMRPRLKKRSKSKAKPRKKPSRKKRRG